MTTDEEILRILDDCCASYAFPMLDNGYVYPAASRLSVYHSPDNWALVFELFGFAPRSGLPDTTIMTFAGKLSARNLAENYVTAQAYQNYLANNPHNEDRRVWPIADGDWIDPDDGELLSESVAAFVLRGSELETPSSAQYAESGIELSELPRVTVFEFCRWLASNYKQAVLATPQERRISLDGAMQEILVLDDWNHPDLAGGEVASQSETFRQLARVLATGDVRHYQPTLPPSTHWRNWPDGGTL